MSLCFVLLLAARCGMAAGAFFYAVELGAAVQVPESATATATATEEPAELLVLRAKVHTQDPARAHATAFAVRDGVFVAIGDEAELASWRGPATRVVDAGGRRVIPGLCDAHLHAVRGGRFFHLELRWDGVTSLERGLDMIREQARATPAGQWVRVVGGWSPYQFRERRMPTVAELNEAAPDVPVLVLFLYGQVLLNRAGVEALGLTPRSPVPPGGRCEFLAEGGAVLHAEPNPALLYGTIGKLPELSKEERLNSTRHFYRELHRFGLTSVVDPGGGGHDYPADYEAARAVDAEPGTTLRVANYLFAQKKGEELQEIERWTATEKIDFERARRRWQSFAIAGAGENLVWSAGDFENFSAPRPELLKSMDLELGAVVRVLARHQWPLRIHATYDESITRILDVLEPIFDETKYRSRWAIDHAETIGEENLRRIQALGGGIAVQDRLAFAGELFADRYGKQVQSSPPLRRMIELGIPLAAGTDGTRVSSYDPWLSLAWMVTGKTIGGTAYLAAEQRLTRAEALQIYTLGSAWLSGEEDRKGRIAPLYYADFAILSDDYFAISDEEIRNLESLLTAVGGEVVYASEAFADHAPAKLPPVLPSWSPVARFGGHQRLRSERK